MTTKEILKKIKRSRCTNEEKILYLLSDNTKVVEYMNTKYLVSYTNDVLVEIQKCTLPQIIRFNYDIIWIPLLYQVDINYCNNIYPYLEKIFCFEINSSVHNIGGVSVKYLPYDKY